MPFLAAIILLTVSSFSRIIINYYNKTAEICTFHILLKKLPVFAIMREGRAEKYSGRKRPSKRSVESEKCPCNSKKTLTNAGLFYYNKTAHKKAMTKTVRDTRRSQRAGDDESPVPVRYPRTSLPSCSCPKTYGFKPGLVRADGIPPLPGRHMIVCLGG